MVQVQVQAEEVEGKELVEVQGKEVVAESWEVVAWLELLAAVAAT